MAMPAPSCSRKRPISPRSASDMPLASGREDNWNWSHDYYNKNAQVEFMGSNGRTVFLSPSNRHAATSIWGERPLNNGRFYWELKISGAINRALSIFGIGTHRVLLHANRCYLHVDTENKHGKTPMRSGVIMHKGIALLYAKHSNKYDKVIGLLYDGIAGTLSYYENGEYLGIAFSGLHQFKDTLFPIVATSIPITLTLQNMRSEFGNLKDRCNLEILKHINTRNDLSKLGLPVSLEADINKLYNRVGPISSLRICRFEMEIRNLSNVDVGQEDDSDEAADWHDSDNN